MRTAFPKIAAILLTVTSVAFMGMSVAAYFGRPDPISEMGAEEVADFKFEGNAEGTSWKVTPIIGTDQDSKPHTTAYGALLDAFEGKSAQMNSETDAMSKRTTVIRDAIEQIERQQEADIEALDRRIAVLTQLAEAEHLAQMNLSQRLQGLSVETKVKRDETTRRRQDVIRLQNELEELKTDQFRLVELRRLLTDRLLRFQLENENLELRYQELQKLQKLTD
ncbi:MAG: hypothetical protein GY758_25850 [Fuerstiella sp.]|nr:hypothetical protein [Fuerstiella sp.]MCP4785221.1 hypothetical protein [Fuerstiella sp.]MCP4853030.1 hypothetical protein [Fuerstiella sp.]